MNIKSLFPNYSAFAIINPIIQVIVVSHPWSNSIPKGDEDPVFLAYFPSALSNI